MRRTYDGLAIDLMIILGQILHVRYFINRVPDRSGSRKKYLGGLAPHHLGGNNE